MSIPNRQIGTASSIEESLLHTISKQIERLSSVIGNVNGINYNFSNGLTESSGNVVLGGPLTANAFTYISYPSAVLQIGYSNIPNTASLVADKVYTQFNISADYNHNFSGTYGNQINAFHSGKDATYVYQSQMGTGAYGFSTNDWSFYANARKGLISPTNTNDQASILLNPTRGRFDFFHGVNGVSSLTNRLEVNSTSLVLSTVQTVGTTYNRTLTLDINGLKESADYSASYTSLSHTNKTYVDSNFAGSPFSVNVVSPTAPNRTIKVTISGVDYYIAAKTTND